MECLKAMSGLNEQCIKHKEMSTDFCDKISIWHFKEFMLVTSVIFHWDIAWTDIYTYIWQRIMSKVYELFKV